MRRPFLYRRGKTGTCTTTPRIFGGSRLRVVTFVPPCTYDISGSLTKKKGKARMFPIGQQGYLLLFCFYNNRPLWGLHLQLLDQNGRVKACGISNICGMVCLPIQENGCYRLQTEPSCIYTPLWGTNPTEMFSAGVTRTCIHFVRRKPMPTADLVIILKDKNYPEYTLSKGAYTLWRIY